MAYLPRINFCEGQAIDRLVHHAMIIEIEAEAERLTMEITIYNPQKDRLETRDVTVNEANTTWFDNCLKPDDVYMITDTGSGLLIRENNFNHPVLVCDVTRGDARVIQSLGLNLPRYR